MFLSLQSSHNSHLSSELFALTVCPKPAVCLWFVPSWLPVRLLFTASFPLFHKPLSSFSVSVKHLPWADSPFLRSPPFFSQRLLAKYLLCIPAFKWFLQAPINVNNWYYFWAKTIHILYTFSLWCLFFFSCRQILATSGSSLTEELPGNVETASKGSPRNKIVLQPRTQEHPDWLPAALGFSSSHRLLPSFRLAYLLSPHSCTTQTNWVEMTSFHIRARNNGHLGSQGTFSRKWHRRLYEIIPRGRIEGKKGWTT